MSEITKIELAKKIFAITDEDVYNVRQYYNISQEEIDRDCEIIKEWMKQQAHFPDDYDKRRIERFLLRNKFRVERTKHKLESYYTIRGENQTLLKKMDPSSEAMQTVFKAMDGALFPKLMNGTDRIFFYRFGKDANLFSLNHHILLQHAMQEFEVLHDYAVGVRFLIDYENLSMTHIKQLDINMLAKCIHMYRECMSGRILSIDKINLQPGLNIVLNIIKKCLPEKVYNKINVHADLESLRRCIPAEYLPREYEGKLGSICEMQEDIKELYLENTDFFMKRVEMVSDENKRVGGVKKNELFGVDGTFKNMNLD